MASVNICVVVGNAGKDAELQYSQNGAAFCRFSVAVSRGHREAGEWVEDEPVWFNVTVFGDLAERAVQQVTKGSTVLVEGRVSLNTWDRDDGTKGAGLELTASRVQVLSRREGGHEAEPAGRSHNAPSGGPRQGQGGGSAPRNGGGYGGGQRRQGGGGYRGGRR